MIAFIQPFGLHGYAGGPKLLRGLLQSEHPPVLSINTGLTAGPAPPANEEIHLASRPGFGRLDRTRLHNSFGILDGIFRPRFEHRLRNVLRDHRVKLIHTIPHTYDVVPISRIASELAIPFFLNVHDDLEYAALGHPLLARMVKAMGEAWRNAKGIFVISDEIGREYSRRFGARDYQVLTDGLAYVPEAPLIRSKTSLRLYFMGLFHLTYAPNFRAVLDALKIVRDQQPGWEISVTSRGGWGPCPVNEDDVPVKVMPFAPDVSVVDQDILSADMLYQPLPFQPYAAAFGRFSMSTKMVSYLGSGLPILYHGPQDAAACKLLGLHNAAITCTTLDAKVIAKQMIESASKRESIANNALALARSQFMLADQQSRFWSTIAAAL